MLREVRFRLLRTLGWKMGRRVQMVVIMGLLLLLVAATPAAAGIRLTKIVYDPAGKDTGTNSHLNQEVVVIANTGTKSKKLGGWKLRDAAGATYRFPADFVLRPGKVVRVHTGKGQNDNNDLFWGRSWYVWNNTGDRAVLKNRAGNVVDRCKYAGGGSVTSC